MVNGLRQESCHNEDIKKLAQKGSSFVSTDLYTITK